jgi:hypothetical protein
MVFLNPSKIVRRKHKELEAVRKDIASGTYKGEALLQLEEFENDLEEQLAQLNHLMADFPLE